MGVIEGGFDGTDGGNAERGGSAGVFLVPGLRLLAPEESVAEAMLQGWVQQQHSRLLEATTIGQRVLLVRRFLKFTSEYPWRWSPADVEEWTSHLVSGGLSHSTIRNYQTAVALFCDFVSDPRYRWAKVTDALFGTVPVQVFHEWNTVVHASEFEGRPGNRPLTRDELQAFFDYCDARVSAVQVSGRKGWLSAFRTATLFKVIYAWGLRRREAAMLETVDWTANARSPEFGRYGALSVRWGKALKGGPPRRRTVLTTMGWASEAVAEWVEEIRPTYPTVGNAMWPTERQARISVEAVTERFRLYRDAIGLDPVLGPHCLRHSYATHLAEDGFDHLFIQQQLGHSWGSTTAIYTSVGSDYKNRALRQALDRALHADDPGRNQ